MMNFVPYMGPRQMFTLVNLKVPTAADPHLSHFFVAFGLSRELINADAAGNGRNLRTDELRWVS